MSDWIPYVSLILTGLALFIAIRHGRRMKSRTHALIDGSDKLGDSLKQLDGTLDELREANSTRFEGVFPHFIEKIIEILKTAKHEVLIIVDVPGYGMFSDHIYYARYRAALMEIIGRGEVEVNILFLSKDTRELMHQNQFDEALNNWDTWKQDKMNKEKLEMFLKLHASHANLETLTSDEFFHLVSLANHNESEQYSRPSNANTYEVSEQIMVYTWIVDAKHAVFAFPDFRENAVEKGFYTSDRKLINELKNQYVYFLRQFSNTQETDMPLFEQVLDKPVFHWEPSSKGHP